MDCEPAPINWTDDSSEPPGSFVRHRGFASAVLGEVLAGLAGVSPSLPKTPHCRSQKDTESLNEGTEARHK